MPWRDDLAVASSPSPTVFIVDDDGAALHSLLLLLKSEGLAARGFGSAEEFLCALPPDARGCVVSDVRMPGMDGVQLLKTLTAASCLMPVIVITGHADVSTAVQAMKAGAADFIEKPLESDRILQVVRSCLERHDVAVDGASRATLIARRLTALSVRERQVLHHLLDGDSNKVIALRLGISPRTVEIYRASVMLKMQASSLSELVRMTLIAGAA
jgi:two-component system response regulator FixJ